MESLLLTVPEAADALALGRSKVYALISDGALRAVRVGGGRSVRVPRAALDEFVSRLEGEDERTTVAR